MRDPTLSLYILLFCFYLTVADRRMVKFAVYEHNVTLPPIVKNAVNRQEALHNMMINLEAMKAITEEASKQGAKLIVLPEYGIFLPASFIGLDKTKLIPYLERIPNPKTVSWNPCDNPGRFLDVDLSSKEQFHIRRANYGDLQPCQNDPDCPSSGHLQFNTNIVYDNRGTFIAKYHKFNLYYEFHFDTPKQADITTFQTLFGTFGVFTCFDILFHDPTIELIEKQGVRNIVFPTAWIDKFPFFISFHSAFAIGSGINFLSSNLHLPSYKFHGSGIYTPNGAAKYYYNVRTDEGRLLVADIPILEKFSKTQKTSAVTTTYKIVSASNDQSQFRVRISRDQFNMVPINNRFGNVSVCHNTLCCSLSYQMTSDDKEFAFGAFDGLHRFYYVQICTLLKCRDSNHKSCGLFTNTSTTYFKDIEIGGNFPGTYIYPEILLSKDGELTLSTFQKWQHNHNVLVLNGTSEFPLLSVSLFSRVYSKDRATDISSILKSSIISIVFMLLSVPAVTMIILFHNIKLTKTTLFKSIYF
ncbi:LOW QUALITY PROTEIN: hypothetical protein KUTeg_007462 [Tegillarca granosa]|uniref:CN hydrolase domain-containing protein n=1 Tax=Tegillarca granosa TaxID=220873 RepID=A0ABQ9FHD4_TEGGR|nr:LOW QUALITY PROTEIN: hypothetical protein KUTeg_007462 [Tegillarca granosa]